MDQAHSCLRADTDEVRPIPLTRITSAGIDPGTGEEALEEAARDRPDLALMNIGLAGEIDGIQAAEEINRRFAVPVVYLTSHADEQLITRSKESDSHHAPP